MLTLRQIEVIRAVMVTGTVNGAAQMLNVSAPGVSRIMKHAEGLIGLRLFSRQHGRYLPTVEAAGIFGQIQDLSRKMKDLQDSAETLKRGASTVFSFASVSSISQYVVPRAVRLLLRKHPDLQLKIDVIKIDEAIDYMLLRKGELAAMSYKLEHPSIDFQPLAPCSLVAVAPAHHPLAKMKSVTVEECLRHPLIGFDPADPYGRHIAQAFFDRGLTPRFVVQARYAHTVLGLVAQDVGVAVLDAFSVAGLSHPGVVRIPLDPPTPFMTYIATNAGAPLSTFAESLIKLLRQEAKAAGAA
jgi:DNA-binding transcriptional LysR family regulator